MKIKQKGYFSMINPLTDKQEIIFSKGQLQDLAKKGILIANPNELKEYRQNKRIEEIVFAFEGVFSKKPSIDCSLLSLSVDIALKEQREKDKEQRKKPQTNAETN